MVPTRLDFDASHAPKNCNDIKSFRSMLGAWVPQAGLRDDAERRLSVRIRWSSTGGKQAEIVLEDALGVTLVERHTLYAAKTECYKVLWTLAYDSAEMLGAFEPPLPKAPVAPPRCPPSVPCPVCPPARSCPTNLPFRIPAPTITSPNSRSFIGIGGFVGSGIHSRLSVGPLVLLGFVPAQRLSQLHVEFEGAWSSQTTESTSLHSVPVVGSLCWVKGIVRFCGGVATTIIFSNQGSSNDPLRFMFGGNFRVGTELFRHGPFSIRADVFGRLAFAERRFGTATSVLNEPTPFAAGLSVLGAWSFD